MAKNDNIRNTYSKNRKGNPSDTGKDKAALKEGKSAEELKKEEEIRNKHLNEDEEVPSDLKKGANPNRNENKTDNSKPAYGSSK